ncbi:UDP:flavonoid glycosyltransferase YjiC (YdhE family) [Kitasatospora sp. MAA19]|uniref:nucleotide disphospho-sugar-binding domain-containing protein n=1 Tax=Kitasatospora sp. MAA19 TaxID=3035090 RepID=UPI002474A403|nr:nucleotide disphospho-sugar-binding domain-containing protein [Kitasatospora sp. MAA19]MDH6709238.1 UDP:flavonoid glycosyltransferase YjiC (YdhE family) [Kitasatospora sp. MAA19]
MRVLFAGAPGFGHLFPLVPLARAMRELGHEVAVASMDGGEPVAGSGLPYLPIAPGVDWRKEIREAGRTRRPDLMRRVVESNSADREAFVPLAAHVNSRVADAMVELATRWRPDLVVYEYQFPVALLAAARLGVPAVQHDLGFVRTPKLRALMLAEMADTFARHGIDRLPEPADTIDLAPPSMAGEERYGSSMRPVAYNGEGEVPDDLAVPADRPRVAVTLGTVPPKTDGLTRIERVIAAAADVDAEFVLATGELDLGTLGTLPDNVRPYGWVPWRALLETCAAAIHHGGSSSALGALDAGIPQLVLPDGSDRFITADAVRERGAGLSAGAEEIGPALLDRLLTDDALTRAAREVSAEIATMPSPRELAQRLTALGAIAG